MTPVEVLHDPDKLTALINNLGFYFIIIGLLFFWLSVFLVHGSRAAIVALALFAFSPMVLEVAMKFPDLCVAGSYSPPFRALTDEEDAAIAIQDSGAQVVWVGIGTPKQDFWMRDHVGRIPGATLIGVGAAFDFQSGTIQRAPKWMQTSSLEWLHRLASEPRRLWYRYLIVSPLVPGESFRGTNLDIF